MSRRIVIAGNWKMNKTPSQAVEFIEQIVSDIDRSDREVVIIPPFVSIKDAWEKLNSTSVLLGAQNMHYESEGAYTGEISAEMLYELGCKYVLVAHSERRQLFCESSPSINLKIQKALDVGINPIFCVGENLETRESGGTNELIKSQLKSGFENVKIDNRVIIAYEPLWAIGTGKNATSEQAEQVCLFIRDELRSTYGGLAEEIRILYGGSVKASNAKSILNMENIDGVLVGGASLTSDFIDIVNYDN